MAIRTFAYSAWPEYDNASSPHGVVYKNDLSGAVFAKYPDRGRTQLTGGAHAYPLCMLDDFMVMTRRDAYGQAKAGGIVYLAPLRVNYTYSEYGTNYSDGVREFLVPDGVTASSTDTSTPSTAISNTLWPMAMYLGGNKAVIAWTDNSGNLYAAICQAGGVAKHRLVASIGTIGKVIGIGLSASGAIVVAVSTSGGIFVSGEMPQASFGVGAPSSTLTGFTHGAMANEDGIIGIAIIHNALGSNMVKAVSAIGVYGNNEGTPVYSVIQAQWLGFHVGSGTLQLYGPAPSSSYDGNPPFTSTYYGTMTTSSLMSGTLTYTVVPGSYILLGAIELPTQQWNAGPELGSRWGSEYALPMIIGVDADPIAPTIPLFWINTVKTQERP